MKDQSVEYKNLITGDRAQQAQFKRDYFELEVVAHKAEGKTYCYRYGTSQGENLCAFATEFTFGNAWIEALTYTPIGGVAYQEHRDRIRRATVSNDQGFDPYAGNLDYLLGY